LSSRSNCITKWDPILKTNKNKKGEYCFWTPTLLASLILEIKTNPS
jgi:hypothetical protein